MKMFKWLRGVAAVLTFAVAQPVLAETDYGFSNEQTKRTVDTFTYGIEQCATVDVVYRLDCLRQTYSQTVRVISKASVYWEAEVALTRVNRGLYSFVRANMDAEVGRARVNGGRIKAVTEESLPQARAQYMAAVDRAAEEMRSGSSVEARYFEPIAEAILASKELLQ
ncbi:hypothetical protein J7382_12890 [Shimia sp. R11_0]|uniref:hypothetical protein n=1 Tax=Shimia sp. R11_0 TaxID=2821096 RepID=UPI001ADB53A6|nr:hypothetical protein [Shimia sp. R11_0]MBO9478436.1 hypothetical protein [Shimia sp. R11_0]